MIVSRSPYRISFFGGGTDYEDWFSDNGGSFLSMAINYYTYITLRIKPSLMKKNGPCRNKSANSIFEFLSLTGPY